MDLDGVALIVGAGSAIGRETAKIFVASGVLIVISVDIDLAAAKATSKVLGDSLRLKQSRSLTSASLAVDVTDQASVEGMMDQVMRWCKRIDYFVSCLEVSPLKAKTIPDMSVQNYRTMHESHSVANFLLLRSVLRVMQKQDPRQMPIGGRRTTSSMRHTSRGSIVVLTSTASEGGLVGLSNCISAQHAVKGLVQTAALENARNNIRVNAVAPSFNSTPALHRAWEGDIDMRDKLLDSTAYGRLIEVDEVVDTIAWLAGQGASAINGQSIVLDGGSGLIRPEMGPFA